MKKAVLGIIVLLIAACPFAMKEQDYSKPLATHKLIPGDLLNIVVEPTEDLSTTVTVQSDGKIALKLIGDIQASGLTLKELSVKLQSEYAKYVANPVISVTLKEFNLRMVYIMGEVKNMGVNNGAFRFREGMTFISLLSSAGGFTNEADLSQVKILRWYGERRMIIALNANDIFDRGDLSKDVLLCQEDLVYLPQKGVTGWNWFLSNVMPSLYMITSLATVYYLVKK